MDICVLGLLIQMESGLIRGAGGITAPFQLPPLQKRTASALLLPVAMVSSTQPLNTLLSCLMEQTPRAIAAREIAETTVAVI